MPYVTYTAKRSLIAGHSAGVAYSIEFSASVIDRSSDVVRHSVQSLGGNTESLRIRNDVFYDVEPNYITAANLDQWFEFLDSVDNLETFTFDPDGTVAAPVKPMSVELSLNFKGYSVQRLSSLVHYKIRFSVRKL